MVAASVRNSLLHSLGIYEHDLAYINRRTEYWAYTWKWSALPRPFSAPGSACQEDKLTLWVRLTEITSFVRSACEISFACFRNTGAINYRKWLWGEIKINCSQFSGINYFSFSLNLVSTVVLQIFFITLAYPIFWLTWAWHVTNIQEVWGSVRHI